MDVKLPKLGEGSESGVVVTVFVKAGDTVAKGQALLELENEKAVASVPSTAAGTVTQVFVKPGDKISVGQRLIAVGDASAPVAAPAAPAGTESPARPPAAAEPVASVETGDADDDAEGSDAPGAGQPAASPTIRRLAKDLGLDLARIRGSERGGRVVMADLRAYIQRLQRQAAQAVGTGKKPRMEVEPVDFAEWGPVTIKPLTPLRQTIAQRLGRSWEEVPRVTQFDDADVTQILALRKTHAGAYEQRGTKLTVSPFLIRALVTALQKHPVLNSSLDPQGQHLVLKSYFHIGIAVDTEAGLMVPVIRDADKKSLVELSRELEDLARKARERKLGAADMKGGSFTISNQGGIGGAHFTPIVNLPEVAILGVGRATVKPVWREGKVEPRTLMPLALSYDHRVIDGGTAARFITDLVREIEQFAEHLVKL